MIKGLYSAVSAMVMNAARQQVLSHNISNMDTPGFKQILTSVQDFMQNQQVYVPAYDRTNSLDYVGTLGLGSQIGPEFIDFAEVPFSKRITRSILPSKATAFSESKRRTASVTHVMGACSATQTIIL